MNEELLSIIKTQITTTIKEVVNGKIDALKKEVEENHTRHSKDMERILPVVEAFEGAVNDINSAKKGGRAILWTAGSITALGGAYLVLKQIF